MLRRCLDGDQQIGAFACFDRTTPAIPLPSQTLSSAGSSPLLVAEEAYDGPRGRRSLSI
jgi:hypothetical protein